ncbi:MAG: STAS domain-containing protein [Erythrobacter sp.]|uniref:STAS domain-containing protein n=1 Tax=Erythrobacter sp. TaxID=1042 RepID=UPI0026195A57|nr:STAS domain-containing protein [Erythrobacter sp.]MDJ0977121.1 STAS domain-containing protein [Erythrobacter sp.]
MNTITLPATCDRASAGALCNELCEALGPAPLGIDASGVERIGQSVLQVLVSAARSDGGIVITASSEAFRSALELTGLEGQITSENA